MERIEIQLEIWEDAIEPICTEKVNLDSAEKLLYQAMKMEYGYTDEEIKTFLSDNQSEDSQYNYEKDKWSERLCKEEEAVVIECGGIYYDDIEEYTTDIYKTVQELKKREQQELVNVVRKYGKKTKLGHRFDFNEQTPIIAAYSHDEPADIVVTSVIIEELDLSRTQLLLLAHEKNAGFIPVRFLADEAFAGQLEFVISEIIAQAKQ